MAAKIYAKLIVTLNQVHYRDKTDGTVVTEQQAKRGAALTPGGQRPRRSSRFL